MRCAYFFHGQGWGLRRGWVVVCRPACLLECRLPLPALPPLQRPNRFHPRVLISHLWLDLLISTLCIAGASGHAAGTPRHAGAAARVRAGNAAPGHAGWPSSGHGSRNAAPAIRDRRRKVFPRSSAAAAAVWLPLEHRPEAASRECAVVGADSDSRTCDCRAGMVMLVPGRRAGTTAYWASLLLARWRRSRGAPGFMILPP